MTHLQILLNLANEELQTAELLLNNHRYRASVSRAYYAIYRRRQEAEGRRQEENCALFPNL